MSKYDEPEMNYLEFLQSKVKVIQNELDYLLRNVSLSKNDVKDFYGLFSQNFYDRDDVSSHIKEKVRIKQNKLEFYINDNKYISPNDFFNR